jgi:glycosyltransferase involved in cell wall biosynthesis
MKPLVSIACISYNQAGYIRSAIEGFLIQKTNFPIEIIIHDDCSTDGTDQIVKEYEMKYPDLIFPIYQKENQYSKGIRRILATFVFPKCNGKYIAICEGDDYWTDPYKLQKQVDCLENNKDLSFCFHSIIIVNYREISKTIIAKKYFKDKVFSIKDLIYGGGSFVPTPSIVFKKSSFNEIPDFFGSVPIGDYFLTLVLGDKGNCYYIDEPMAVYRKYVSGSWSESNNQLLDGSLKHYKEIVVSLDRFNTYSQYKYDKLIKNHFIKMGLELYSKKNIKSKDELKSFGLNINFVKLYFIRGIIMELIETFWHSIKKAFYKISLYFN